MQEQSMAGQGNTARPMTVNEETRHAILERRDMELAAKHSQREELESQIKAEHGRLEELVRDRDMIADAFAVSINACELRLDALRRALDRHHEDDPDMEASMPHPGYVPYSELKKEMQG